MTTHTDLIAQLTAANQGRVRSQRQIADRASLHHSTVSKWTTENRVPNLETFCKYAAASGFSVVLVPIAEAAINRMLDQAKLSPPALGEIRRVSVGADSNLEVEVIKPEEFYRSAAE